MSLEIRTFRNLDAWQRAIELVVKAYKVAEGLPSSERYELSAQIRRAAVSIPANIAEGHERRGKGYIHHLRIALGSLSELETHFEVAVRLRLKPEQIAVLAPDCVAVGQLVHGLRRSVKRRLLAKAASGTAVILLLVALTLF